MDELLTGQKVAAGAGLVVVIGAFLPWVDAGLVTVSGTSGDGVFTLLFGAIAVGLALFSGWRGKHMIAVGLLGILTTLIAFNVYGNLGDQADQSIIEATAGGGLHLTLIGGLALIGTGIASYFKERNRGDGRQAHAPQQRQTGNANRQRVHQQQENQQPLQRGQGQPGQPRQQRQPGSHGQSGQYQERQPRE